MTTAAELLVKVGWDDSAVDKGGKESESKVKNWAGALKGAALGVGAAVGAALVSGVMTAMDNEAANDKLAAKMGVFNPEMQKELGTAAGNLYKNAYGESISDVNDVIASAFQGGLLSADEATTADIENVTSKIMDMATAFDQDFNSVVRGAGNLVRNGLAPDVDAAMDIMTRGFQQGADKSEDFMDTLNEYSVQFKKLGIDGADATGLLVQGLNAGARDGDKVADAFKEFSIRAIDGSTLTAESFKALGLDAEAMTATFAKGGPEARAGLDDVMDRLKAMEDPALRAQVAVGLFGTQAEDLGDALYALDLDSAAKGLGDIEGAAVKTGTILNDNLSVKFESFKRKALGELADLVVRYVIPALEKFGGWVTKVADIFKTSGLEGAAGEVFSKLGEAFVKLEVFIYGTVYPAISSALLRLGKLFGSWVVDTAIPYLQENIPIWFGILKEWLDNVAIPWLGEKSLELAKLLGGWIGAAVTYLAENLPGWIVALGEWIGGTALPWLGEQVLEFAKLLGNWILDGITYLKNELPGWIGAFTEWATGTAIPAILIETAKFQIKLVEWIAEAVRELPGKLMNWTITFGVWAATEAMPALIGFGKNVLNWMADGIVGAGTFLFDTGQEIINGLINGIWSMAGRLSSEVSAMVAENIPGPIRDVLGIFSPSRVTMELGRFTAQGLAEGIAQGTPGVEAASSRMVDKISPTPMLASVTNISNGGGTNVGPIAREVHIHTGSNVNADQIVQALIAHQRRNGALPFTVKRVA